jgi:hypothetical protein
MSVRVHLIRKLTTENTDKRGISGQKSGALRSEAQWPVVD